jgi:aspartyl/asparaginyl beta-hydroxylase (cupin superfamily)/Flp pilus assembly protein TadD
MSAFDDPRIRQLAQAADQAAAVGRMDEAAALWQQVTAMAPGHPKALFRLGQHALYQRKLAEARTLLEQAAVAAPKEPLVPLNIAYVHRALRDDAGEMAALTRALVIDPYFFPAVLAKGMLLERMGEKRQAAYIYKDALALAPPDDQLAPEMRNPMRRARALVEENASALEAFLQERLAPVRASNASAKLDRFEQCREVAIGQKRVFTQNPSMLHVPALPAIQFYDPSDFPWLEQLEAATGAIREELLAVMSEDGADIRPYLAYPEGARAGKLAALDRSPRWSAHFLWEDGKRIEANCASCPRTAKVLETIPMLDIKSYAPTAMFSILSPRTHIPGHSSVTNARLVVHLPLIVPGGCRFRVGNETREWRDGKAWIFDDTIEHEAWNDSDDVRAILMFDIWNPFLSHAERALVSELLIGIRDYYRMPIPRP